jgi:hypothetical protein
MITLRRKIFEDWDSLPFSVASWVWGSMMPAYGSADVLFDASSTFGTEK